MTMLCCSLGLQRFVLVFCYNATYPTQHKIQIMKKSLRLLLLISPLFMLATPAILLAQDKTVPPPPKLEKLEEGTESDIKLLKPESNKTKMVEKRQNGKVTEVQVRTGKSSYTVKPNDAPKGTPEGDANRAAQWKVFEFGGKKEHKEVEPLPVLAPGPHSTTKTGTTKLVTEASSAASASATAAAAASATSSASASANQTPVKH